MGAKEIYIKLREAGLTVEGACGLMGNMQAESAMQSNIAQRGMTGLTDAEYTAAADAGTIDFAHDAVGYGLCQWTFWSRKQALLNFARERGVSVCDEWIQVEFCLRELRTSYPGLLALLKSVTDVYTAASEVCTVYERPAVNNITVRAGFANQFYSRFAGLSAVAEFATADEGNSETAAESYWPPRMLDYKDGRDNLTGADVLVLQSLLAARGYECPTTGDFDARTRVCVMEFQGEHGLVGDGVAGNDTWNRLLSKQK